MIIYPYKMGSESAKNLADELGCKQIKHEGSKFVGKASTVVINWGASKLPPEVLKCKVINKAENVANAADKLKSFNLMADAGVSIPEFTESRVEAERWIEQGLTVVCRTVLNGHSGEGIVLADNLHQLVAAPLYVKYIPKKQEYRAHVMFGQVRIVQRKARRAEVPDNQINWKIRNHDNGFIFAKNEALGEVPPDVYEVAIRAVSSLGLDFGAVDIIYNDKQKKSFALEVNTAPGISGDNPELYAHYIQESLVDDGMVAPKQVKEQAAVAALKKAVFKFENMPEMILG